MPTDFHYVPTSGDLSGKSFEEQTERVFNELGAEIDQISQEASDATVIASQALQAAQQAETTASAAEATAQDALQRTESFQNDVTQLQAGVIAAQTTADTALAIGTTANATANNALTVATHAQTAADSALAVGLEADNKASNALIIAEGAATRSLNALGVYETLADAIDANAYFEEAGKYFVTNLSSQNFPVNPSLWFRIEINDTETCATQTAWPSDVVEASSIFDIFTRIGTITTPLNDATEEFIFTATPATGVPVSGTFTAEVATDVLTARFTPGELDISNVVGAFLYGAVTFDIASFTDGIISVGDIDVIRVEDGIATFMSTAAPGANCLLRFDVATGIALSATSLSFGVVLVWNNTEESVTSWSTWKTGGAGGAGAVKGKIDLLPFRTTEMPEGWYYCNGDQYPLSSPQGAVLDSFSDNFKSDWGITVAGNNISLPKLFYTDGRGYFLRAATTPGGIVNDRVIRMTGSISPVDSRGIGSQAGVLYNAGNTNSSGDGSRASFILAFDNSRQVTTSTETSPLTRNMVPAIYLGA